MRVLNVAEKPSVARAITGFLSQGNPNHSRVHGSNVAEFPFQLRNAHVTMVVTAVRGHLVSAEFPESCANWQSTPIRTLFSEPLVKSVKEELNDLRLMLRQLAPTCEEIILWLDCDREGEAIAFEVLDVCLEVNANLRIYRAVFSALTRSDIMRALNTLRNPDQNLSDAVLARTEIDLRIGASFTRFMTLRYRSRFRDLSEKLLSYGPCQFPTLGFVVERWQEIQRFVPETFWTIKLVVQVDKEKVDFNWRRKRLFDHLSALVLCELCVERPLCTVTFLQSLDTSKWRPVPLSTIEMCKILSMKHRLTSQRSMQLAEGLYQKAFISYPRTETEVFDPSINLIELVQVQANHPVWGQYSQNLLNGRFTQPRIGPNNDNAHPPIHPVKSATQNDLDPDEWRVYDYITRHFLACVSPDAKGRKTEVEVAVATELFSTSCLIVTDRGYLEIYPFDRWGSQALPPFELNQTLPAASIDLVESTTKPPELLTECDLLTLMDKNGIGTDATMAEHINTIQKRSYAVVQDNRFMPTTLGVALVEGYQLFGQQHESKLDLSKPMLRAEMERDMTLIARGQKQKAAFLQDILSKMYAIFCMISDAPEPLDVSLARNFQSVGAAAVQHGQLIQGQFSRCKCGQLMDLKFLAGEDGGDIAPMQKGRGRGKGRGKPAAKAKGAGGKGKGAGGKGKDAGGKDQNKASKVLVCPDAQCNAWLSVPDRALTPFRNPQFTCPICNFGVLSVTIPETGREHQLCPYCFRNPPREHVGGAGGAEMRCFQCAHPTCALAGGRPAMGVYNCANCTKQMVLKQSPMGFRISCSGYPQCKKVVWLPKCISEVVTADRCIQCNATKLSLKFTRNRVNPAFLGMIPDGAESVVMCVVCDNILERM
eukprot:GEMP01007831.1.p1 GENE.GEMP01007831.1~~GEMP01007831.1.p1  ORF type:complete len:880 (+),score=215.84 GEMP01007831.1:91-2730(+)